MKNRSSKSNTPLKWEHVNEVTWKLTDGEMNRTPASHGQWGGFNTTRALCWAMGLGWIMGREAWVARCGSWVCRHASLAEAKAIAGKIVRGTAGSLARRLATCPCRALNIMSLR